MKFRILGTVLAFACLQSAMAQPALDTIWICHDSISMDSAGYLFFNLCLADTPEVNTGGFVMIDTGDSQDGSRYINFDYQFTNAKPGYAGFKIYWDTGYVKFNTIAHDSMFLFHKGPFPNHKVKLIWAEAGDCFEPKNYQYFGEFASSDTWKRESFPFPAGFVKKGLYELRILIYDDSTKTTDQTSGPGCLKLDNMGFIRAATSIKNPVHAPQVVADSRYFKPMVSGKVTLAIYSLQGEQLFKQPVDVSAGKKYDVNRFAEKNSNLPAGWIHCVKITGPGMNITRKVIR